MENMQYVGLMSKDHILTPTIVQALHAIALFLNINPEDLFNLIGWTKNSESLDPNPLKSVNTNLCYFHYFDKNSSYTTPQVCDHTIN